MLHYYIYIRQSHAHTHNIKNEVIKINNKSIRNNYYTYVNFSGVSGHNYKRLLSQANEDYDDDDDDDD